MDPASYSANTDPVPYIAAAYLLTFLLVGGYAIWTILQAKRIKRLISAAQTESGG